MKITQYTNYILIEGLEEHSQAYSDKSFRVEKLDRSSVLFLLEIISPFDVKINLYEEIKETLIVNIDTVKTVGIFIPEKQYTTTEENNFKPIEKSIELEIEDNVIIILNKMPILVSDIFMNIKKYKIDQYSDFYEENKNIAFETNDKGYILDKEIPYTFDIDYVYKITCKYNGQTTILKHIAGKPTCYFSSIYHLKQFAANFDLYLDYSKKSEFDLKLMIWKYSNIVKGMAGISGDIIYDENYSILNEYVTQKILSEIVAQSIRDSNITPDKTKETLGSISVTLADLSHGAATVETITTQLVRVHKELTANVKDIEKNLRNYFSYLQAQDNVPHKENRIINRETKFVFKGGR